MSTIALENNHLSASIKSFGAELTSLVSKQTGLEYIWQAGKEWPKSSPVLFPIVGSLKNGSYIYKSNSYKLERHGFARTREFAVETVDKSSAVFLLKADEETLKVYPFQFELRIKYELKEGLEVTYEVRNTGDEALFFSIGAHPAFKVPLNNEHSYNDYFLEFSELENTGRWMLKDGLLEKSSLSFLKNTNKVSLSKELFFDDAVVLKNLMSDCISIKNTNDGHGMHFNFKGYPFFGIWAAKNADFVCLEPWLGITDSVDAGGLLEEKEGILKLQRHDVFDCRWSVNVF